MEKITKRKVEKRGGYYYVVSYRKALDGFEVPDHESIPFKSYADAERLKNALGQD